MGKWLAAAALILLIVVVVLWRQLGPAPEQTAVARPVDDAPMVRPTAVAAATGVQTSQVAMPPPPPVEPASDPGAKIDPKSDEFFYKFEELVVPTLSMQAVKCYEGIAERVHRNQDVVLGFKHKIVDGKVTIHDVYVKESTLRNPALEACFIQQVRNGGWTDPRLPDMPLEDDEIVLNPERGLKKYTRENMEYVGAEGPKWPGGI